MGPVHDLPDRCESLPLLGNFGGRGFGRRGIAGACSCVVDSLSTGKSSQRAHVTTRVLLVVVLDDEGQPVLRRLCSPAVELVLVASRRGRR